ncbi:MAG: hypothetical protein ACTSVI_06810 [Promethearchaeota archaeon]
MQIIDPKKKTYLASRKKKNLYYARSFKEKLKLDEQVWSQIEKNHDWLWHALPTGTKLHSPEVFAEILVFHVLKKLGKFTNPELFCKASPLGNMSMHKRKWLLNYKRYLPTPKKIKQRKTPDLNYFISKIIACCDNLKKYKSTMKIILKEINKCPFSITPRVKVGVACLITCKLVKLKEPSFSKILKSINVSYPGSIYNALERIAGHYNCSNEDYIKKMNNQLYRNEK